MAERRPGKLFRVMLIVFLAGIFFELFAIIGILGDDRLDKGNIAVVDLRGMIGDPKPTVDSLRKFTKNKDVKAIILRVDTPGGPVGASQEIYEAVKATQKKKKVIISMGDVAASGGYYVAAPADLIVANPGTLTGSLGVISQFINAEGLLRKLELKVETVKSGRIKDIGSPLRNMTQEERKLLQAMTDDVHEQFMEAVAQGRKLPMEKVRKLSDGRVMSGRQAKKAGLVDELGGLEKAIELAAKIAGIKGEPEVIYPEPEKFGWFRRLAEGKIETPALRIDYRLAP